MLHVIMGASKIASDAGINTKTAKRAFSWEGLIAVIIASLVVKSATVLLVGLLIVGIVYGYKTGGKLIKDKGNILKEEYLWLGGSLLLIIFAPALAIYTIAISACAYTFYKDKEVLDKKVHNIGPSGSLFS